MNIENLVKMFNSCSYQQFCIEDKKDGRCSITQMEECSIARDYKFGVNSYNNRQEREKNGKIETIPSYCEKCKNEREFILERREPNSRGFMKVYRCPICSLQIPHHTEV